MPSFDSLDQWNSRFLSDYVVLIRILSIVHCNPWENLGLYVVGTLIMQFRLESDQERYTIRAKAIFSACQS